MNLTDRAGNFIKQSQQVHNDKYDYSKVIYSNIHTPVEITCPTHGSFKQTPNSHISKRAGCPQCAGKRYFTLELFLQKAHEVHGNIYDYSKINKYLGYETKHPIVCKQHGKFLQTPKAHILTKHGCPKCGTETASQHSKAQALTCEQFTAKAINIHGEKYDYSKSSYSNSGAKIEIICREHGSFFQTPNNHISRKQGCPKCGDKKKGSVGGYSLKLFENFPERSNIPAMLYVIEMQRETDNFIKVGITTRTIKERFDKKARMGPKHITKTVLFTKYSSLKEAFLLEQQILSTLKQYQYFPNYVIDGRTECLKNKPEVLQTIQDVLK